MRIEPLLADDEEHQSCERANSSGDYCCFEESSHRRCVSPADSTAPLIPTAVAAGAQRCARTTTASECERFDNRDRTVVTSIRHGHFGPCAPYETELRFRFLTRSQSLGEHPLPRKPEEEGRAARKRIRKRGPCDGFILIDIGHNRRPDPLARPQLAAPRHVLPRNRSAPLIFATRV